MAALAFGLLVLGPHLSDWVGSAIGAPQLVKIVWWVARWPILVGGLLFAFAGILYLGPNVDHPRWRFLSFGSALAVIFWLAASGFFAFYVSQSARSGDRRLTPARGCERLLLLRPVNLRVCWPRHFWG